ncbi:C6 transcription factor [Penicillium malachiteum]|nr:C6 transcription factor [Penicillium malachiteum]
MPADATWVALYYAMLAAIALLTYIGRNLGQSKQISVMVAAATRIAQCLGLHNIGLDKATNRTPCADPTIAMEKRHDREVSKRV